MLKLPFRSLERKLSKLKREIYSSVVEQRYYFDMRHVALFCNGPNGNLRLLNACCILWNADLEIHVNLTEAVTVSNYMVWTFLF